MRAGRTRSARPKGKIGGSQALPLPLRGLGRALSLTLRLRLVLRCVRALFGRFRRAAARDLASHPWCFRAALRPSAPIPERRARQPQPMNREARVLRYKEKRKNRKFDKTIRCACYAAHLLARLSDARSRALGWLAVMHRARRMPRLGRASRAALPSAARCRATRATCRRGRTGRRGRAAAVAACRPTMGWMTSRRCSRRRALGARRRLRRRCSHRLRGCVPRGTYDHARRNAARFEFTPGFLLRSFSAVRKSSARSARRLCSGVLHGARELVARVVLSLAIARFVCIRAATVLRAAVPTVGKTNSKSRSTENRAPGAIASSSGCGGANGGVRRQQHGRERLERGNQGTTLVCTSAPELSPQADRSRRMHRRCSTTRSVRLRMRKPRKPRRATARAWSAKRLACCVSVRSSWRRARASRTRRCSRSGTRHGPARDARLWELRSRAGAALPCARCLNVAAALTPPLACDAEK